MHIGIDYTAAVWQGAGIGRYTRELTLALVAEGSEHRYTLFYAAGGIGQSSPYLAELRQLCAAHPAVRAVPIPIAPRRLTQIWQRLRIPMPIELFTGRLDVLHAPDFVLPPTRARTLVTIHDLSFLVHPELAAPGMVRYLSSAVPRSVRRAHGVLADSEATRQALDQLLPDKRRSIEVVYPGVNSRFHPLPVADAEAVRLRLHLPARFLLFVSTLEPRKNLVRLLEAFARLAEQPATRDLHLVIGGRRGWLYDDIFATIERLALGERIRLLDFVDDKDLPALYNLAWAFTYPSIYEGFGLPALEALACGAPVLTANNSSLPEVVGDAAVLVDAESVDSIYDGLARISADTNLRAALRAAGPARASRFRWEQAAQQVLQAYDRVVRQQPAAR